jgi:fucose permease
MKNKATILLILTTYIAFISLGLPDGLLGIAWPFMSAKFHVPLDSLGILLIGFVTGYLSTSLTSGKILSIIPLGIILTLSSLITGLSLFVYAFSNYWQMIVVASFFLGSGGGAIDSSINAFAASRFSPSVVNWLHAFYGIGATCGPLIITWFLAHEHHWNDGYLTVGTIQIILSVIFIASYKYWKVSEIRDEPTASATYSQTLRKSVLWMNIFIFFFYVGLEIGIGQWLFTLLTQSRKISEEEAGLWTSFYWGGLTLGRIVFGFVLTRIETTKVITFALIGILIGTCLVAFNLFNVITLIGIVMIGFCNGPVFPSLISLTPKRVGEEHANHAIGFQVSAAMVGGALLPALAGLLTDIFGLEIIPKFFLIVAFLLLVFYSISSFDRMKK